MWVLNCKTNEIERKQQDKTYVGASEQKHIRFGGSILSS